MFDNFSDGYCPQCLLDERHSKMFLNRRDYWECPFCHLQAAGNGAVSVMQLGAEDFTFDNIKNMKPTKPVTELIILRTRGSGHFKDHRVSATEHVSGSLITRQGVSDPFGSDGAFQDETEFRGYLVSIV